MYYEQLKNYETCYGYVMFCIKESESEIPNMFTLLKVK